MNRWASLKYPGALAQDEPSGERCLPLPNRPAVASTTSICLFPSEGFLTGLDENDCSQLGDAAASGLGDFTMSPEKASNPTEERALAGDTSP